MAGKEIFSSGVVEMAEMERAIFPEIEVGNGDDKIGKKLVLANSPITYWAHNLLW